MSSLARGIPGSSRQRRFVLGGAYLCLRLGDVAGARKVMALFDLPSVRSLGWTLAWLPVRWAFWGLVRCPSALVGPLITCVERLDLVRRVRAAGRLGHGELRL